MRNASLKVCALTRSELEAVRAEANFTEDQAKIFDLLNRDDHTDVGIMLELGLSPRHYYRVKKITCEKVGRIAKEKGYLFVLN